MSRRTGPNLFGSLGHSPRFNLLQLKTVECRQFLERLDVRGMIQLPECRIQNTRRIKPNIDRTRRTDRQSTLLVKLSELSPLLLSRVRNYTQRQLWYEYMDRYHYLGYRTPFGAQLRAFIQSGIDQARLGCLQFSSPAWRMMAARDSWIGWSDEQRRRNLQKIITKNRFLIFPWVQVKNLASSALSLAAKKVPHDWLDCYGRPPVLMETLVWMGNNTTAHVTRPPIGCTWGKPQAGDGWTGKTGAKGWPSRIFIFIRYQKGFGKS